VGDALYRVPRTLIQHAEALKLLPVDRANGALCLYNITPKEMEAFLDVADAQLIVGDSHYTSDQWVGALAVANPLGISQVRKYAIPKLQESLDRLDPFARIDLADKYRVDEWMAQPVLSICERPETLTEAEVLRLGTERVCAISRVREKRLAHKYESGVSWARKEWPVKVPMKSSSYGSSSSYGYSNYGGKPPEVSLPYPNWQAQQDDVNAAVAAETKRLIDLETALCQSDSKSLPSPSPLSANSRAEDVVVLISPPHHRQSDLIIMKVQNFLYRLPLHYFKQSGIFKIEPSNHSQVTIVLPPDVEAPNWDIFLEILTARLPFPSWAEGLRLAKRFGHETALKYILQRIRVDFPEQDPIDILEAVKIAESPDSPWIRSVYSRLSQRDGSLTLNDILRIGEGATAEVCKLREQVMYNKGASARARGYY
ncbi:hypothetical protein FRB90_004559, partial [Tulasnella sp. 427]